MAQYTQQCVLLPRVKIEYFNCLNKFMRGLFWEGPS